ncbi:hypothetical protein ACJ2A9_04750 [Anaerobacillus sp. MEB173]|uniref:hypothetical protein n=1 Tax=Anaerobacillus sp. MEB173 TaxID=3383345 RepID=UPI003F8DD402
MTMVAEKKKTFGELKLVFSHDGDVVDTLDNVNELNIDLHELQMFLHSKGHKVDLHDVNVEITEE